MWDESEISVPEVIKGRFALSVKCTTICKKPCWISNVYGPTLHQERKLIWLELSFFAALCLGAWCVGGDFNVFFFFFFEQENDFFVNDKSQITRVIYIENNKEA